MNNTPIQRAGDRNGQAQYYINGELKTLNLGLNQTRVVLGRRGDGSEIVLPNRRERRNPKIQEGKPMRPKRMQYVSMWDSLKNRYYVKEISHY